MSTTDNQITTDDIISAVTIKNAIDLSIAIIIKCSGNDISNQIDGEAIESSTVLDDLVASTIRATIVDKI